ncbi:hypothetical protein COY62_03905 [bacterium (Candidatus Howlettbacteria) CG_4_10_14_0_8_um_filter_40_9]|nr:MAG: hypothetical protein COY62_03905 [bacterium (Candidatus Howlettbacteria) CG_4_10_14_0_8_um_filter_40_9]
MKKRLDVLIFEKGYVKSREEAKRLILSGNVLIGGRVSDKVGTSIDENSPIEIKEKFPYVSRGALKIEKAYHEFEIDLKNKIICDIGASTGGFTDFALQKGAKKVFAIDVGYGQLDQKLRNDPRVINMERTNIRDLDSWKKFFDAVKVKDRKTSEVSKKESVSDGISPKVAKRSGDSFGVEEERVELESKVLDPPTERASTRAGRCGEDDTGEGVSNPDIFVIDVSFTSLKNIIPTVKQLASSGCHSRAGGNPDRGFKKVDPRVKPEDDKMGVEVIVLIKPQFEVGKKIADKCKGVIKDETIQNEVVEDIKKFATDLGFEIKGVTDSPILGAKGNKEFLIHLII